MTVACTAAGKQGGNKGNGQLLAGTFTPILLTACCQEWISWWEKGHTKDASQLSVTADGANGRMLWQESSSVARF